MALQAKGKILIMIQEVNLHGEFILKYYACFKMSSLYPCSELLSLLNGFYT